MDSAVDHTQSAVQENQRPPKKRSGIARGFFDFVRDYGILPLAVGVILANSVNDFVKALADDIVTPLISLLAPQTALQTLQFSVGAAVFKVGAVLSALLTFLIIAAIVYVVAKLVLKNETLLTKK